MARGLWNQELLKLMYCWAMMSPYFYLQLAVSYILLILKNVAKKLGGISKFSRAVMVIQCHDREEEMPSSSLSLEGK